MTKQELEADFAKCVVSLHGIAGTEWVRFLSLLAERIDHVTEDLVSSPPQELQKRQGAALALRSLATDISKAPKLVEDLRQKEHRNGTSPR